MFGKRVTGDDKVYTAEHIDHADMAKADVTSRRNEMPELVRLLSPDERHRLETKLRQRIDLRLMPMLILMYLMNYLDRNNIATARLAGLEEELELTQTQYQV